MIENVKDKSGRIISYIEWSLHSKSGALNDHGDHVFITDWWVHEKFRRRLKILKRLIKKIYRKVPQAEHVYWQRSKYHKRISIYGRKEILGWAEIQ